MGKETTKDHVVKVVSSSDLGTDLTGEYVSSWCRTGGFGYSPNIEKARKFTEHLSRACIEDLRRQFPYMQFKAVMVRQAWVEVPSC